MLLFKAWRIYIHTEFTFWQGIPALVQWLLFAKFFLLTLSFTILNHPPFDALHFVLAVWYSLIFNKYSGLIVLCLSTPFFSRLISSYWNYNTIGISTSCGIPDFRGPRGIWTLEKEGLPRVVLFYLPGVPDYNHGLWYFSWTEKLCFRTQKWIKNGTWCSLPWPTWPS